MDQSPFIFKEIFCKEHSTQRLDLIDLTGTYQNGRMCAFCFSQNEILNEQSLEISELFGQEEKQILSTYPPFKSQKIREYIQRYCNENISASNISSFFSKLRKNVEEAIYIAENNAKQQLIKYEDAQMNLIYEYEKIAETNKLRNLIVTQSQDIGMFLQEKWEKAEQNEKAMQVVIDQMKLQNSFINLEKKEKAVGHFLQSIRNFGLFDRCISQSRISPLLKSTAKNSSQFTTLLTEQNTLQLINQTSIDQCGQAFLDFVLDPKKKYTIKLFYQPYESNYSDLVFGIAKDSNKDVDLCWKLNRMNYHNKNENWGITKYIRGPNITNYQRINQKEEFEVRINLDERILRVASLPYYESVIELDNPNKIDPDTLYRFYIDVYKNGDMIEITDVIESDEFENNEF